MKYFTIDSENNVTVHANRQAARDTGAGVFCSEVQLADLVGPNNQRLIEIWNSLPGVKPVTKFTNRKVATERIWKAIQNLGGAVAPAPQPEAPVEIPAAEPVAQPEPAPVTSHLRPAASRQRISRPNEEPSVAPSNPTLATPFETDRCRASGRQRRPSRPPRS